MSEPDATPLPTTPPRRSRRRVIDVACVVLVAVLAAFYATLYWMAEKRLQEALAETDRLDPGWRLEELHAKRPTVPAGENAALQVALVIASLPRGWSAPIDNVFQEYPEPQEQLTEKQTAALREELKKIAPVLAEARKLAGMPLSRCDDPWDGDWLARSLPRVQGVREFTNLLTFDARLRLQERDVDGALECWRAILNAARSTDSEPTLISLLVRIACRAVAQGVLERALAQGQPSEAALAACQRVLENEDSDLVWLNTVRGERAFGNASMEAPASGDAQALQMAAVSTGNTTADRVLGRVLGASLRGQRTAYLKCMNEVVEAAKLPADEQYSALEKQSANPPKPGVLVAQLTSSVMKIAEALRRNRAQLRCALAAVAAERYRRQHGQWPASLNHLLPGFVASVPVDPYDGQPLRYRRLSDGAVVYSIGLDKQDNNGNINRKNPFTPETDIGSRLWDVARRRQPPPPDAAPKEEE